jgi:hypothetical protein
MSAAGQEVTPAEVEEEWEVCPCCGLWEECTPAYAARVRARYGGRWLCGLCGDAVCEEVAAVDGSVLEVEATIARHATFCRAIGWCPTADAGRGRAAHHGGATAAPERERQAGECRSSDRIPGALMNNCLMRRIEDPLFFCRRQLVVAPLARSIFFPWIS